MPEAVIKSPKNIRSWLVEHNSQEQARRNLVRLSACYDWAIEQELLEEPNPFKKFKKIKNEYPITVGLPYISYFRHFRQTLKEGLANPFPNDSRQI